MDAHLTPTKPWAMFRSVATTAANGTVPLGLRGQDATNSHNAFGGVVELLANKTYIISAGLPNDNDANQKNFVISKSTNGGATWTTAFGNGFSGVTGGNSAGTSVTDVLVTTVPTKLKLDASANGLAVGVWLYLEVK